MNSNPVSVRGDTGLPPPSTGSSNARNNHQDWVTRSASAPQSGGPDSPRTTEQVPYPPNTCDLARCSRSRGGRGPLRLPEALRRATATGHPAAVTVVATPSPFFPGSFHRRPEASHVVGVRQNNGCVHGDLPGHCPARRIHPSLQRDWASNKR